MLYNVNFIQCNGNKSLTTTSVYVVLTQMLDNILCLLTRQRQNKHILELHLFVNVISNSLLDQIRIFNYWEVSQYYLQCKAYRHQTPFNWHYLYFLLYLFKFRQDNKQNNKSDVDLLHFSIL